MNAGFFRRHPSIKDYLHLLIFAVCVAIGTIFINTFIFRTFSVVGPSMEPTMYTSDRLIVNRLPVTMSQIKNTTYIPERGEVIVFKNPRFNSTGRDEYIVKRVIGLPGERVQLANGVLKVYNAEHPEGLNPDTGITDTPSSPISGEIDTTVPAGTLFVVGDHRNETFSFDSRNGLGFVPLYDVIGPVGLRIWPLDKLRTF